MANTETDIDTFRKETHDWLVANCPASMREPIKTADDLYWGGRNAEFISEDQKVWFERMLEKRWIAPQWDIPYGGAGLSNMEFKVLTEEMTKLGCRKPLFSFGISMLGPALLKFATEEQKVHYLNDIVEGKVRWCQGYSEPGAGSDLAGLQMRADDQGDNYNVSGQKVWTSYGDQSDWIFCLVRTNQQVSKHLGVSFLLIDMATEGVSTSPIKLISGKSPFAETFMDHVKVPKANLIGSEGQGWTIAKFLLTHERQMIGGIGGTDKPASVSEMAVKHIGTENGILSDTVLRSDIAAFEMDEEIFDITIERALDEAKAGNSSGALSSMFKYFGTELNKDRYELYLQATGSNGIEWEGEASENGRLARQFCRTKANSIEGGTSEIQLNIISKRILGLPS